MRSVSSVVLVLQLCLVGSGSVGVQQRAVLDDLVQTTHYVRALITESQQNDLLGESERQAEALKELATVGAKAPRWALLHALAEEHERLSWREGSTGSWHGARAACLYSKALGSRALRSLPAHEFSGLFNRTALAIRRLSKENFQCSSTGGQNSLSNDSGPPASMPGLNASRVLQEQDEQCAATRVEYERWRDKRDEVINFALASAFHPLKWLSTEGLATKKTVHISELREAFASASLDSVMRPVVKHLWQNFSPERGEGVAKSLAANSGTDLREVLTEVRKWRSGTGTQSAVDVIDVRWWDKFLRACAVDGPTSGCPKGSELMTEADLDHGKSSANQLQLQLNAAHFPLLQIERDWYRVPSRHVDFDTDAARGAKVLPIWLRVCQRTDPLALVLRHLRLVHGIEDAVLLVSVDRDLMEPVLELFAQEVDYMQVRIFFHPYTHSRASLGFHQWDTGVHRLNSHYLFGLRLALITLDFKYVITLEDDLVPSRDFLSYHRDLWAIAEGDASVAAILAYPNGPRHDCHFIASKLRPLAAPSTDTADGKSFKGGGGGGGGGLCAANASDVLYADDFFAGWGAGIPRRTFYRFLPAWNFSGIYDGILNGLLSDGLHTLAPCRPRVRIALNTGLHGVSHQRWDHWLYPDTSSFPQPSTSSTSLAHSNSVYRVIDPSAAAFNDTVQEMESDTSWLRAIVTQEMAASLDRGPSVCQQSGARSSDQVLTADVGDGDGTVSSGNRGRQGVEGLTLAARLSMARASCNIKGRSANLSLYPPYRIWSSDFHVGPIGDLKIVWGDLLVHGRPVQVSSGSGHVT